MVIHFTTINFTNRLTTVTAGRGQIGFFTREFREREKKLRLRFIREREKLITKLENGLSKHENRSEAAASAAYRFTFWGVSGGSLSVRRLAAEEGT